jgi:hypothetical protein
MTAFSNGQHKQEPFLFLLQSIERRVNFLRVAYSVDRWSQWCNNKIKVKFVLRIEEEVLF